MIRITVATIKKKVFSRRFFKRVFVAIIGVSAVAGLAGAGTLWFFSQGLPSLEEIDSRQVSQSTKIYDRDGVVLLYEISGGQKRTVVPLDHIPKFLKDATIAIEDERFYEENAVDFQGILRALIVNFTSGQVIQGASTITQQLARNAFLTPEQTISRKVKELILAIRLDRRYSKDRILEAYLNEVPYGPTLYGVEAASRAYFGKSVSELNLSESAIFAAIVKAPSYYSPLGTHIKELLSRQKLVLNKLRALGNITDDELKQALAFKVVFQPQGKGIKAPHFVLAVQDYLITHYGEDMVRRGGLQVRTTLDWNYQELAEKVVKEGALRNESLYKGKNAALVAEDPVTGQILAMVGSRDYFDQANEGNFNVATQGFRQPGSALKPFVYLAAFLKGYTPNTVLFDVPTEFAGQNVRCPLVPNFLSEGGSASGGNTLSDPSCFHPQNFDDNFRGPVPLRRALAQSVNIPSVKTLYLVGLGNTLSLLRDFGIRTLENPSRYGLSLVLGGGEVHLTELTNAYATLAREGMRHAQSLILEVQDNKGSVLESYKDDGVQVVDPQYSRLINNILSDVDLRSGLFASSLPLTVFPDYDVALKTGTSNDYRDAWAMGYTPSLVVGVWAGNNDNTPMERHGSSILAAVPLWHAFMEEALKKVPKETFTRPDEIVSPKTILNGDYLAAGPHSILFSVDRSNPAGPEPLDPTQDSQFDNWEIGVHDWLQKNDPAALLATSSTPVPNTLEVR